MRTQTKTQTKTKTKTRTETKTKQKKTKTSLAYAWPVVTRQSRAGRAYALASVRLHYKQLPQNKTIVKCSSEVKTEMTSGISPQK